MYTQEIVIVFIYNLYKFPAQLAVYTNFRAFSWAVNQQDALHSEYGCLHVKTGTSQVSLTTVMNNGN